ncbi:hypothetical protein [Leucobacter coleopterorum]|uniref:hypothetical protein n=1 Tax=Leucobacter coleopterorum TaxID=2714933 RepID=UPI003CC6E049
MGFAELRNVDPREFHDFAIEFGEVVRSLPFQLPENFLLVVRAISLTSGVCSALNPDFNLWESVEPYAAQLLKDEGGNVVQDFAIEAVQIASLAWRLPKRVDALIDRVEDGSVAVSTPRLERKISRLERTARRLISALLFGALLIAGAVVRADDTPFGTVLLSLSVLPLLHALFAGRMGHRPPR